MSSKVEDPRSRRTRSALVDAGLSLFGERAPDAVTIDEIVSRAGVGKGSFYNHFTDREGLVRAIGERLRCDVEEQVRLANAGIADPAVRMVRANFCYYRFAIERRAMASFALRSAGWPDATGMADLDDGLWRDLEEGIASGRFRLRSLESGMVFVRGVVRQMICTSLAATPDHATGAGLIEIGKMVLLGLGMEDRESEALAVEACAELVEPLLLACPAGSVEGGTGATGRG